MIVVLDLWILVERWFNLRSKEEISSWLGGFS
jgi:hypothetical protein